VNIRDLITAVCRTQNTPAPSLNDKFIDFLIDY